MVIGDALAPTHSCRGIHVTHSCRHSWAWEAHKGGRGETMNDGGLAAVDKRGCIDDDALVDG